MNNWDFMYNRNYLGYGDDWEIGGIATRDRLPRLHYINCMTENSQTWYKAFYDSLLVTRDTLYVYTPCHKHFYKTRDFWSVVINQPWISVEDFNRTLREKMHNKPTCYSY